ncbi:MAG: protein kinase [Solirubrobacterales bacterium]|nr:protein kinase [Solirubrobacterales bacterium]
MRHIATGGMASVWCARDRALGRNVAIKLLAERFAHDDAASERFMREARAAARLSGHPNVVMIYDVSETDPVDGDPARAFIVMEYLAGGTVADAIRVDSVRRVHAVKWVHEAASALDYAHTRGVLHRDIKPANLLLDRDRVLHVADFGIARLGTEDTITSTGQVIGTASYLAPERALGRPATGASDRYSLAVAAYELLVGERPFTASHFAVQARQHVEDAPPAASERNRALPPAVDAVLAQGMAKRPEQRWPTGQAFAQALEAALSEPATKPFRAVAPVGTAARSPRRGSPTAAARPRTARPSPGRAGPPPAGATRSATRTRRRHARVPALAALAAGAAVAALAIGTLGGGGGSPPRDSAAATRVSRPASHPRAGTQTTPAPTHTTNTTVTVTPAAATTPAPVADTLEAHGHQLMENGQYSAAIPVLRQAVGAAPHGSLTYAYALYDLGRSLRLSGDPKAAVTVLYERLQIPNQTDVVREQLQLALLALGQQADQGGGSAPSAAPGGAAGDPGSGRHGHPGRGGQGGDGQGGGPGVGPPSAEASRGALLGPAQGD